jgi:mono/diheme cytochrome c family protein
MRFISARFLLGGLAIAIVCAWTTPVFPQGTGGKPAIKMETAKQTPPDSGPIMFAQYCAPCHGARGEGNGPAAPALKKPPANLTLLAKSNGGTFPQRKVEETLRHGVENPAHGNSEMPVWGPTFRALGGDSSMVTLRISNLSDHLRTLQAK